MSISYRGGASGTHGFTGQFAKNVPMPTHQAGDLLIMVVTLQSDHGDADPWGAPPAGWTLAYKNLNHGAGVATNEACWFRIAPVGGVASPVNIPFSSNQNHQWDRNVGAWIGVDPTTPVVTPVPTRSNTGSTASPLAPSVNAAGPGLLVCIWSRLNTSALSPPGTMASRINFAGKARTLIADQQIASAGATGTRTATSGTSYFYTSASFALNEAPPVGAPSSQVVIFA